MAKQTINIGSTVNDGTGTTLRAGGDLINDNFNEIYTAFGDGSTLTSGFVSATGTVTLTNKTLTSPVIANITSTADIDLTATNDVNIPANVGLTFGDDAEKIEGDGTNLTISGHDIILDAADNVIIDSDTGTILRDGGTHFATLSSSSGISITCNTVNGDVLLRGNDGGSFITALTY